MGDGVAYASKHLNPDYLIDIATLTGAQMITTGLRHAGIVTPSEEMEREAIQVARNSGDLVFPMIYAPELLVSEFNSKVADMKNSVKVFQLCNDM